MFIGSLAFLFIYSGYLSLSMKIFNTLCLAALMGAFLVGCGGNKVKPTGFMANYDGFEERDWSDGAQVYLKKGESLHSLGKYSKIMLLPTEVWYGQDASYKGMNPDELKYVTDKFVATLKARFEPDYPFVDKPGPDELLVRSAITGVNRAAPERSALGYIPIAFLYNAGKNASASSAGQEIIVYSAALELEVFDSVSGERLAAVIDSRASEEKRVNKGQQNIRMIDNVIDYWVTRFKRNWDSAHN